MINFLLACVSKPIANPPPTSPPQTTSSSSTSPSPSTPPPSSTISRSLSSWSCGGGTKNTSHWTHWCRQSFPDASSPPNSESQGWCFFWSLRFPFWGFFLFYLFPIFHIWSPFDPIWRSSFRGRVFPFWLTWMGWCWWTSWRCFQGDRNRIGAKRAFLIFRSVPSGRFAWGWKFGFRRIGKAETFQANDRVWFVWFCFRRTIPRCLTRIRSRRIGLWG